MLEFLKKMVAPIAGYKASTQYRSVFLEISGSSCHESCHSDILAYYLKNNTVKRCFIEWLNLMSVPGKEKVSIEEYVDGVVAKEYNRTDIFLFSSDGNQAIIVENKSDHATDQGKQLPRYFRTLSDLGVNVERVVYLNKNSIKSPEFGGLTEDERQQIEGLLIVGQLVGHRSFTENVINRVLAVSNDIRLSALSQEIRDLFFAVTYGGGNMEDLSSFLDELKKDGNLERLRKLIQAYEDIPIYLTEVYKTYLLKKETGHKIFLHKPTCLVIDRIFRHGKQFAIEIWFSNERLDFSFLTIDGSDSDVDKMKTDLGEEFPFREFLYGRYRIFHPDPLDDPGIKQILDQLLDTFKVA